MKNNIELFIKYLDDQMNIEESKSFEDNLRINSRLKEEFEAFRKIYSVKNSKIEIDDRYFSTLLPNVKMRLGESKPKYKYRYALILPAIILVVFFLFRPSNNDDIINDYNFENLWVVITQDEDLAQNIVNRAISIENNYLTDSNFISEFYSEEIILDESVFDYLESHLAITEINNNLVDSLSENEFNNLYESIIDKKILGMK